MDHIIIVFLLIPNIRCSWHVASILQNKVFFEVFVSTFFLFMNIALTYLW
jgi:hypothetical protein